MKKFGLAILIFTTCQTNKIQEPSIEFKNILNNKMELTHSKLKFNGFYYFCNNSSKYFVPMPIYFFKNGLLYWDRTHDNDSIRYKKNLAEHSQIKFRGNCWGTYEFSSDTIKAKIMHEFNTRNEQLFVYKEVSYQGILRQNGMIDGWQMVMPYPKLKGEYNQVLLENAIKPKNLCFKYFPEKTTIDSNKVWINDYRNGK